MASQINLKDLVASYENNVKFNKDSSIFAQNCLRAIKKYMYELNSTKVEQKKSNSNNLTNVELIKNLRNLNISPKTVNTAVDYVREFHTRISNQLNIPFKNIKAVNTNNFNMSTSPFENEIKVNFNSVTPINPVALMYSVSHETFHNYQYFTAKQFACKESTNDSQLIPVVQHILFESLNSVVSTNKDEFNKFSYFTDLLENGANIFSMSMINQMNNKSLISDKAVTKLVEYETYARHFDEMIDDSVYGVCKQSFIDVLETVKNEYNYEKAEYEKLNASNQDQTFKMLSSQNDIELFDNIFANVTNDSINQYYDEQKDKINKLLQDKEKIYTSDESREKTVASNDESLENLLNM